MLKVNIDYFKDVNYALVHNGIAICKSMDIEYTADGEENDISNVMIACSGEYITAYNTPLMSSIAADRIIRVKDFCIKPDAEKMAELTDHVSSSFIITAWKNAGAEDTKVEIFRQEYDIELMTYDQWLGTSMLPQTLASFVTPNNKAVTQVLVKAAQHLKDLTGSSSFTAYQSGNPNVVLKQVAAIYAALMKESIVYRSLPVSYDTLGQRVTLPEQVLTDKLGNCIEISILFASVLEAAGINSGVILQKGHAYLGVWLVDDCCRYSICDDASYIEKKTSVGIEEMIVLECTDITEDNASFEHSMESAKARLADLSNFEMFIDIRRCRLERFLPLPTRVKNSKGVWEVTGVEHENYDIDVSEHSRYDLSTVMNAQKELTKMDIWERKLLDFSLRNTMLNMSMRMRAIQLVSFNVDKLEDSLQEGEEYCVVERPDMDIKSVAGEKLIRSKLMEDMRDLVTNDIEHHTLHSYHTETETKTILKNIYRGARNAIEETGANSLFLTIGALRWYETDQSETPRFAPILMLPVEMVCKKGNYYIRTRDEEIMLNVTLIEFLRQNYDVAIPGILPLPKDDHGVDVKLIFAVLREALKDQKRWDVEEECILGLFSFSKFLMWNDIHNHRQELLGNNIVKSLVEQKLAWQPEQLMTNLKDKDKTMKPEALALPVAVDSSQMAAVYEAGLGHSFILYGPPGTGKSQTITNLIANALFQGKRVLFVAEKMAALSVVQSRLAKIGLDPFCLEMHSNKITKRHVLDQLAKALGVTHIVKPEEYQATADKLYAQRMKLIDYMEALHTKHEDGFSLYDCILRYETAIAPMLEGYKNNEVLERGLVASTVSDYETLLTSRLDAIVKLVGQPNVHPLLGLRVDDAMLKNENAFSGMMDKAVETLDKCITNHKKLAETVALRDSILAKHTSETIFSEDADALYEQWRSIKVKWFLPRFFAKRSFINKMRTFSQYIVEEEMDSLLEKLIEYQKRHKQIEELQSVMKRFCGMKMGMDAIPAAAQLDEYKVRFLNWKEHGGKMRDWYHWCKYREELQQKGLDSVIAYLEKGERNIDNVWTSFVKTFFHGKAMAKISKSDALRTFEGMLFDEQVGQYKKLTDDFQTLSKKELYAKLAANIPRVTDNVDSSSEIGLLNRNISNGGRGLSLRDLFDQIPNLMEKLCPCMLMSPMSVAQYLDLTQKKFDLVIFDEASQMPTSEAVGAIARGSALVVVGDPKQMPPTSFFSSSNVEEDEADIDDMESILEDCRTLEIPSLQLNWHYRSRHESLIAFSNNEYYDSSLITFPSVDDQQSKVSFVPVDGVYDKGGKRSNKAEAEAIVKEIERRLMNEDLCKYSIGVIAFSVVQQNLIEDLLQDMLDKNKKLKDAADGMYEPIFVKNLENVQGDERDVILFSVGYGPDKEGKVSMNFGPLNNAGGERRLNVAVSRARQEMMVFSTLRASQIDLRRSKARGVEGLKHFLEYAETHTLAEAGSTAFEREDTAIAKQIADKVAERGYVTKTNVGKSKFKIDVAVSRPDDPETYILGILLDGEGYRDTQTTRDREIVQPSVLTGLRWQVMRVWSVDWIGNPERVINRIIERLETKPTEPEDKPAPKFDISQEEEEAIETNAKEYVEFHMPQSKAARCSDSALATNIVLTEQPITFALLCRRVCALRGEARVTPTIQKTFKEIVEHLFYTESDRSGTVIWENKEKAANYPWYRPDCTREITDIPMVEIKNVVEEAVKEQFSINSDSLSLIAAKKLGFTRRGANVELALNEAVSQLVAEGKITNQDNKLKGV